MAKTKKSNKKSKAEKSNFLTFVAGIALGLVLVFAIVAVNIVAKMGIISFDEVFETPSDFVEVTESDEDEYIEHLEELRVVNDLSTVLKSWATNTTEKSLMSNKDVLNFLLMGVDKDGYNADVIMIASLNKKTQKIHLTSVFRDSYTYISTNSGDVYAKINACYANGGPDKLIETIQNDFKIKIDYYVSVNFQSFSEIVDALGGIKLDVKQYEANAVANALGRRCPSGEGVLLDGEQALIFCRLRHIDTDSDVSRTRRQRQFINALIAEAKNISVSEISPLLNSIIKYINTDCSVTNIVSLGTQALTNKWYDYEIVSSAVPSEEHRMDYRGNSWVWIVDYPAAAKALQESIYGVSNIDLAEDRVSAIDIMKNSSSTGNAAP